ncbi:lysoplasmalogenase [Arthrobacter sp. zg-Y1171]|uniref:lysoplasmalogenase n=1 Tax=unclassified Arthrobacter TaxID=235627 RepID=UPI0021022BE1|nr:lysoplasmalogenase [Arthrobacter sp. zg-Y1171]MCQ1947250.1 lysoplasmalogenase [Arthrobacter sp. zg-Y1116]MCQ1986602.1 lysoplasmalogenase [Arthrobacter sp. zg-Y844]MCQ1995263.1 lysoplasmalogenase [Arthrobacter sp. zg-Y1171]UWX80697.1 lysoplasmalogenase [Arthrobacter sp. zg-Y1171]
MTAAPAQSQTTVLPRSWWWGFLPFAAASAVHVGARAVEATDIAEPTKLTLMPLLAVAALWGARGVVRGPAGRMLPAALLLAALFFSWIGDGAAAFFPSAPELPVMLGSFGLAHVCYIWLLAGYAAAGRIPRWALVFPLWWVLMLVVLWPALGGLALAVAAYGIVLAGTAATAARCRPMVAAGGLLFLASDTILAGRIFLPEQMPDWTNPLVMLTYCAGQALIVAGVLRTWRDGR